MKIEGERDIRSQNAFERNRFQSICQKANAFFVSDKRFNSLYSKGSGR